MTDDDLAKTGGKESIFAQLRKKGEVAFPERSQEEEPQLSRIDQLRANNKMQTSFMSTKKKVMF